MHMNTIQHSNTWKNIKNKNINTEGKDKGKGKSIAVCETSSHRYGKSLTMV